MEKPTQKHLEELHHIVVSLDACETRLLAFMKGHPALRTYPTDRVEDSFAQLCNVILALQCELCPTNEWPEDILPAHLLPEELNG